MRYSAILMVLSGLVIAGFTGVRYAIDEPPEWVENSFALELALPLVLAVALVTTGSARCGRSAGGGTLFRDSLRVAIRPEPLAARSDEASASGGVRNAREWRG